MLKSEARKIFSDKRKNITQQQMLKWDDLILIQFQQLALTHINTVFTYAAVNEEVNTDAIVDYLHFRNPALQVCYPVCNFDSNTMKAVLTQPDTPFEENKYGIPEPSVDDADIIKPEELDMIIVPLLCFDREGNRVGYGKGFYDRYLADTRSSAVKVGLSFFEPIDKITDSDKFDVPLNYCITPERMYEF